MYNSEQKERFIKQYTTSEGNRKFCYSMFQLTEKSELEYGKDVCCFDKNEATKLLESVAGIRKSVKASRVAVLRKYVRWCVDNDMPGASGDLLLVKVTGIENIQKKMLSNPRMLEQRLHSLFDEGQSDYEIEYNINNIYKAYYWLAYMGVPENEILEIRETDVDFAYMMIRCNGLNYPLYPESVPVFKSCMLPKFLYVHTNYVSELDWRCDGDVLLRGFNKVNSVMSMRSTLSRIAKKRIDNGKEEIRLSYVRVYLSGIFFRKYQSEISGYEVDFRNEAIELVATRDKNRGIEPDKEYEIRIQHANREYLDDYHRWKIAFGLI